MHSTNAMVNTSRPRPISAWAGQPGASGTEQRADLHRVGMKVS